MMSMRQMIQLRSWANRMTTVRLRLPGKLGAR